MATALEALLGATKDVTGEVYIPRLKVRFKIRALTTEDLRAAENEATIGEKLNDEYHNIAIIAKGCLDPQFSDKSLRDHYEATDTSDCVKKALLPGEIIKLMNEILKLSGFNNEAEKIDEIKN